MLEDTPETAPEQTVDVEAKLAALLQQHEDSLAARGAATEQNEDLTRRLTSIEQTLARISRIPASPSQAQPAGSKPSGDGSVDLASIVEKAISEKLEPVVQRITAKEENDALLSKQRESMVTAVRTLPALQDPASKEYEVWAKLLNGRPDLQKLHDAPYLAAEIVKSLTTDLGAKEKVDAVKKAQATTQPSTVRLGSDRLQKPNTAQEAGELAKSLAKEGETKGWTQSEFADYVALQIANQAGGAGS
jgi:hypothetical protein